MLPTFVIGLREGLEAALIVGIIAAFLRRQGRRDLTRQVLAGVAIAVLLCALVGVALELYSRQLPQRQQEGLETVIGVLAVAMVTYMVIWMRRHSREFKGQLEGLAAEALASGSNTGRAMVLMAFLAVIREGFETVVFLLAAFNESGSGAAAGTGAALGVAVAVALGYGIYRGGVRLNLSKFFRTTGLVLVLVAAGLVVNALHTAHEAGWLDAGQGRTVDLSWLVQPGTVQASLLTGMLGLQPHPVVAEAVGWFAYLVPVACYVAWPPGRAVPVRPIARVLAATAGMSAASAVVLALVAPARPATPATGDAAVVSRTGAAAVISTDHGQYRLRALGAVQHAGWTTEAYRVRLAGGPDTTGLPASRALDDVAELNGGRLPIGLSAAGRQVPVTYAGTRTLTVWLDSRTDRVIDLAQVDRIVTTAHSGSAAFPLAKMMTARTGLPTAAVAEAVTASGRAHDTLDRCALLTSLATICAVLAGLGAVGAAGFGLAARRKRAGMAEQIAGPVNQAVPVKLG
jgi:high-affinity iron transporter